MNITYLAEQSGDKPFLLNQAGIDSTYVTTPLIVAAIITAIVFAFLVIVSKGRDEIKDAIVSSLILAIGITVICLLVSFASGAIRDGGKPQQSSEEFEAWAHARYNISIDVTSDNMRDFFTFDTTDVIDDEGNIVSVRNVNDKIIITKSDDAYQELPHGK